LFALIVLFLIIRTAEHTADRLKLSRAIADGWVALSEMPNSAPPPGAPPLWGSSGYARSQPQPRSATATTPSNAGGSLDPLSRRLLRVVGLLSVLLIGVIVNAALHGDENAPALNPVAEAAAKVERCPGFNFNLYVVYSSPALPGPISAQGKGAYNADTKRTLVTLSLNSPTGPATFVEVDDDTHAYEKSNTFSAELPPGKEWVRTEKDEDKEGTDLDFGESMRMLSDSGNVRVVGHQSVNGKMTRRYRANIAIAKLVELLREQDKDDVADAYESLEGVAPTGISVEAWVDRKNLVRRMRYVMPTPGEDGAPPMTMDMRMDLFNFGNHPDIQLPNPDTVVDGPLDSSAAATSA
jgi:hypothetical protein